MPCDPETLRVLAAVLAAMRRTTAYPEVLFRICEALTRSVPCDRATIYVRSQRRQAFVPTADHGTPPEVAREFVQRAYAPGSFPGEAELRKGQVLAAVRGATCDELEQTLSLARLHALAVLPLAFQGGAEGALSLGMHEPPAFRPEQLSLLQDLAPHIAVLIQNARLEARAAQLAKRRARLAAWAAEVLGAEDLDAVAGRLCEASRSLFGATRSVLLLIEDGELVERHVAGPRFTQPLRLPLAGPSLPSEALRAGQVLVVNRFPDSRYAAAGRGSVAPPAAALAAPLVDASGALGVLTVSDLENVYRFGETDEEDARLLAAVATVALRKNLLLEALTHASAAKSDFLASVSHDLRTPLNVIMGYTQLLAEGTFGPLNAEQADALARILRTGTGQLGLISDLLDLARIEQGKLACKMRAVEVAEVVPSLCEMMDALLVGRPVRFDVAVAPEAVAHTDPERLRQVLVNLLTNAAKFTQAGCVRLAAALDDGAVCIAVEDTGRGMEAELVARAHEPFVRGDGEAAGSGLGLAIVARLMKLLGGELTIRSQVGRGTRVEMRLPARAGPTAPSRPASASP